MRRDRPADHSSDHAFSSDPRQHIAVYRPRCGIPDCREPGMVWGRCRCRAVFARCHKHEPENPMAAARAAHLCTR